MEEAFEGFAVDARDTRATAFYWRRDGENVAALSARPVCFNRGLSALGFRQQPLGESRRKTLGVGRVRRRICHRPTHATITVSNMKPEPSSAAS